MNAWPVSESGNFVHILFVANNHYVTIYSSLEIKTDQNDNTNCIELKVYDSLNSNYSKNILNQLSTILKNSKTQIDKFLIHNIQVTQQPNVYDCGCYAIANVLFLCNQINPGTITLITKDSEGNDILIPHLLNCVVNWRSELFKYNFELSF